MPVRRLESCGENGLEKKLDARRFFYLISALMADPCYGVVDRAGVLDAQFPRHRFTIGTSPIRRQQNITFSLTPF